MFRPFCLVSAASLALVGCNFAHGADFTLQHIARTTVPLVTGDDMTNSTTPASAPGTNAPPKAMPADTNAADAAASAPADSGDTNAAAAPVGPTKPYTVKKGDNPWKIAHKLSPGHTKEFEDKILAANPGLNPKKMHAGEVIQVPAQ